MEGVLGNIKVLIMSVKGNVSEEICKQLVKELVSQIDMTIAPGEAMCKYPVDGKGGTGYTYFQPITESFITFDAWPDLGGAYLFICSCGKFSIDTVIEVVKRYNLKSHQMHTLKMEL